MQKQEGYVSPEDYNDEFCRASLKPADYSDIGQAKVLAKECGVELRYTAATDYIRFCGQYWIESKQQAVGAAEEFLDLQLADAKDEVQRTKELLMETGVSEEAILSGGKSLEKKIESEQMDVYLAYLSAMAYQTFAMKRRDMKYMVSALQAAKPMLEISVSDLERDGFLLNTPDGTYYLPEGLEGRQDHSPEDYITKITAAGPGEQGKDLWLDALEDLIEAANGKPLLVAYWFRPGRSLVKRNGMSWKPFMGRTVITAVGQLTRLPSIFISNRVPPTIKRTAPCII